METGHLSSDWACGIGEICCAIVVDGRTALLPMELPTMARTEDGTHEGPTYRSPKRVLARAFLKSRDRWKEKYQSVQKRFKDRLTDLRDLRRSRDRWRAKAEALEQEANQLRAQLKRRIELSPPALS
jgi:hypothetical protein